MGNGQRKRRQRYVSAVVRGHIKDEAGREGCGEEGSGREEMGGMCSGGEGKGEGWNMRATGRNGKR